MVIRLNFIYSTSLLYHVNQMQMSHGTWTLVDVPIGVPLNVEGELL